ncbi:hypothetical protein [Curtobacterium sp. BRB10]|uniref:hypothetical protein n=1 Tax=Curtobacterium sp. BRB10 TaxID=2962579 RepID=UPI002881A2A8|nr:hypothetical protein [Curtobacterium sp. BRB10]MDT0234803.1 hypothetical protein [Curtobacterium sp. BRB10]
MDPELDQSRGRGWRFEDCTVTGPRPGEERADELEFAVEPVDAGHATEEFALQCEPRAGCGLEVERRRDERPVHDVVGTKCERWWLRRARAWCAEPSQPKIDAWSVQRGELPEGLGNL